MAPCCHVGKLAEVAGEYLRKGAQVYIEGQMRTRSWQDDTEPRAMSPRCWSGRTAPCRFGGRRGTGEPESAAAAARAAAESCCPGSNLLRPRLNPRKRRAVKGRQSATRLSFLPRLSRTITRRTDEDVPFKP